MGGQKTRGKGVIQLGETEGTEEAEREDRGWREVTGRVYLGVCVHVLQSTSLVWHHCLRTCPISY